MARKQYSQAQLDQAVHAATVAARSQQIMRSGSKMQEYVDTIRQLEKKLTDNGGDKTPLEKTDELHYAAMQAKNAEIVGLQDSLRMLNESLNGADDTIERMKQDALRMLSERDTLLEENIRLRSGRA